MNKDLESWDEAAKGWDQEIALDGSYRTLLIANALEKIFIDYKNLSILDAGCGNGYFTKWFHDKGASVSGLDGSEEMIKLAKAKYPEINFAVHDLLKPLPQQTNKYDYVVANMLLMHLSEVTMFFKEMKNVLRNDGILVFSVLHPCFNQPTGRLYKNLWQKITFTKPSLLSNNYYVTNTGRFESHMRSKLTHYHRTLEEYSQQLRNSGYCIKELIEPHQLPESFLQQNPKLEYATRLPRFIFFICKPI